MSDARHTHWETRFATPDYVYGTAPSDFLVRHRPLLPAQGRALAVADGEGRNGVYLAECGLGRHLARLLRQRAGESPRTGRPRAASR